MNNIMNKNKSDKNKSNKNKSIKNKSIKIKGYVYIISGPSGVGKTTLLEETVSRFPDIQISISFTTRKIRKNEKDRIDYNFVTFDEFKIMKDRGDFLETTMTFGNYYGTSLKLINEKLENNIDVGLVIDWQGYRQIKKLVIPSIGIFILPPSLLVLEDRLIKRDDDSDKILSRMKLAKGEISHYDEYDYTIVNDDFNKTIDNIVHIIQSTKLKTMNQKNNLNKLFDSLL